MNNCTRPNRKSRRKRNFLSKSSPNSFTLFWRQSTEGKPAEPRTSSNIYARANAYESIRNDFFDQMKKWNEWIYQSTHKHFNCFDSVRFSSVHCFVLHGMQYFWRYIQCCNTYVLCMHACHIHIDLYGYAVYMTFLCFFAAFFLSFWFFAFLHTFLFT